MTPLQHEVKSWAETLPGSRARAKLVDLMAELDAAFHECPNEPTREIIADAGLITLHLAGQLRVGLPPVSDGFEAAMRSKLREVEE